MILAACGYCIHRSGPAGRSGAKRGWRVWRRGLGI